MIRTAVRVRRTALATAVSVVLAAVLGACSAVGFDAGDGDGPDGSDDAAPAGIATDVRFGKVTGKLARDHRSPLRKEVTSAFDGWVDQAYVASDASDAFATFTKDAAALAKRDRALMSNIDVGDRADSVTVTGRKLIIDVLADHGRPVGVTGRFVLVFELDGQVQRTDRVAGRLLMRRGDGGWLIFGYDVKRGAVA